MNLLSKILMSIVVLLMLVGIGETVLLRHSYKTNAAQTLALNQALTNAETYKASDEATQKAYSQLQSQLSTLQGNYAVSQKKLSDALAANKQWSDTPVPDAVFNSIYEDAP